MGESSGWHIGIVGDGQLGRMNTQAALALGHTVTVLGKRNPDGTPSPAAQVGAHQLEGSIQDGDAIRRLAAMTDLVTLEIEHINAQELMMLEDEGYPVYPSPYSLAIIQNKQTQKMHLKAVGLPVAPFGPLFDAEDLTRRIGEFGQVIAKTKMGGFDGRGNLVVKPDMSWNDIQNHFRDKSTGMVPELYAEQMIPFQRELAVIGVRNMAGRVAAMYPVVETEHEDSICHTVTAPANIDPKVIAEAEELGRATIESFEGAGVIVVEVFHGTDGKLTVNEVAPRVHNAGHYSIMGAETSQFENHIRAITGATLGSTATTAPAAVMVNILGSGPLPMTDEMMEAEPIRVGPGAWIQWYGKAPKAARKIGHITVLDDTAEEARARAFAIRNGIDV